MFSVEYLQSPVGLLKIIADGNYLKSLDFVEFRDVVDSSSGFTNEVAIQLEEYFKGRRKEFQLELRPEGTEFQKNVWTELVKIPFAQLISYKELSVRMGDIKKIRAVGTANGANPIPIIIPCHRVIGSNNNLVGYSGGLHIKRWLIDHEQAGLLGSLFDRSVNH